MSNKGKYALAALAGAAVGGIAVALSTRALPNLKEGMIAHCKSMIAGMKAGGCEGGETCQPQDGCNQPQDGCRQMMAENEQAPEKQACDSKGESCHGSD